MTERTDVLVEAVWEVARIAGTIALEHFGDALSVDTKSDGSPVTIADRKAERAARDWIVSRLPEDGILGEEFDSINPHARRRWIIDPIDGTKSFVRGVPLWGSLVAICEGETVIAGAAFFPALDESIAAATGTGCWWNGRRAQVSTVARVADSLVMTTDPRFTGAKDRLESWERLSSSAAMTRGWSDCYGYLLVATGRAEVMVDPIVSTWDVAALQVCVEEAGGVFSSREGERSAFRGSAVATNALVAEDARSILRVAGR